MMKTYKKTVAAALAATLFGAGLCAQNLNSSVEVTNDYIVSTSLSTRSAHPVEIPDSVQRFSMAFDYSVFDNPYKGAYVFNPYSVNLVPEPVDWGISRFYLRAGAGYVFNPILTAAWNPSPILSGKGRLRVFQDFSGDAGSFWGRGPLDEFHGCELKELFKTDLTISGSKINLALTAGYRGLYVYDPFQTSVFGKVFAGLGIMPVSISGRDYDYALDFRFEGGEDKMVGETSLSAGGFIATTALGNKSIRLDYNLGIYDLSPLGAPVGCLDAAPKFLLSLRNLDVKLGARVSYGSTFGLYPDVRVDFKLLGNDLGVFLAAEGGQTINSYSSLKEESLHYAYALDEGALGSFSKTKLNAYGGLNLCIGSFLQAGISGGYAFYGGMPLYGVRDEKMFVAPSDWEEFHARGQASLFLENLRAVAALTYRSPRPLKDENLILPAAICAEGSVKYTFMGRIKAGFLFEAVCARECAGYTIPAGADIGMEGEYLFPSGTSVWVNLGNLTGHSIERVPFISEKGVSVTLGVSLDLR